MMPFCGLVWVVKGGVVWVVVFSYSLVGFCFCGVDV